MDLYPQAIYIFLLQLPLCILYGSVYNDFCDSCTKDESYLIVHVVLCLEKENEGAFSHYRDLIGEHHPNYFYQCPPALTQKISLYTMDNIECSMIEKTTIYTYTFLLLKY